MTEQELNRLGRRDLLKLLLIQSREAEATQKDLSDVQKNLEEAEEHNAQLRQKLDEKDSEIHSLMDQIEQVQRNRAIDLEQAGNIADAALKLSGIFKSAQDAANLYMENIRHREAESRQLVDAGRLEADQLMQQTRERCETMEAETSRRCSDLERDTQEKCDQMLAEAKQEVNKVWESLTERIQKLHNQFSDLGELTDLAPAISQKPPEDIT